VRQIPYDTHPRTHTPTGPPVPLICIWGDDALLGETGRSLLQEVHPRSVHRKGEGQALGYGQTQEIFRNGKKVGLWVGYWNNGQLYWKTNYKNPLKDGSEVFYHDNGKVWI